MEKNNSFAGGRDLSLDLLRVLACILVVWQHTTEFYYIGDGGVFTAKGYAGVVAWIDSLSRASVPVFVMLSGYFLLPMRETCASHFLKKRAARVMGPFLFWSVVYAAYFVVRRGDSIADCVTNIAHIPVNWGTEVGHLWFVYMLIGVYALVPVLSTWVRNCSKGEMRAYLAVWGVSTMLPYVHLVWPEVLGECYWNPSPLLYYFTGFVGFLLLGSYVRRFGAPSWQKSVAMLAVGYVATAVVFIKQAGTVSLAADVELSWDYGTANVALMAYGLFGLVSKVRLNGNGAIGRTTGFLSRISYSVYLAQIIVLNSVHDILAPALPSPAWAIVAIAICTWVITSAAMGVCSRLPKAHYYLGT